jgi:hypothetical protein
VAIDREMSWIDNPHRGSHLCCGSWVDGLWKV